MKFKVGSKVRIKKEFLSHFPRTSNEIGKIIALRGIITPKIIPEGYFINVDETITYVAFVDFSFVKGYEIELKYLEVVDENKNRR